MECFLSPGRHKRRSFGGISRVDGICITIAAVVDVIVFWIVVRILFFASHRHKTGFSAPHRQESGHPFLAAIVPIEYRPKASAPHRHKGSPFPRIHYSVAIRLLFLYINRFNAIFSSTHWRQSKCFPIFILFFPLFSKTIFTLNSIHFVWYRFYIQYIFRYHM